MTSTVVSLPDRIAAARDRYTAEAIEIAEQALRKEQQ